LVTGTPIKGPGVDDDEETRAMVSGQF